MHYIYMSFIDLSTDTVQHKFTRNLILNNFKNQIAIIFYIISKIKFIITTKLIYSFQIQKN